MADIALFSGDGFSEQQLTAALENVPYVPNWLSSLKLFEEKPLTGTKAIAIESRDNVLTLISTSPRGAPVSQRANENRALRYFDTVRVAHGDQLQASEILGIRAFGSTTELMNAQAETLRRLVAVRRNVLMTHEYHQLGAVQGKVLDADGTTVIRDWYAEFGVSQPAEVSFSFTTATAAAGTIRGQCDAILRATARAAKGSWVDGQSYVVGLCSDVFWDALVSNAETRATYLNQQEANQLRGGTAFQQFKYGPILFVNYRGTDDNSTVAVPSGKCKFFPVNCPDVFQVARGPGESFTMAQQPGQPYFAMVIPDPSDRDAFVDIEVYSYPLYVCTKPLMLQRGAAA